MKSLTKLNEIKIVLIVINYLNKFFIRLKSQPGGFLRVKHSARSRFDAPSSAVSLPSIALFSSNEEKSEKESRPRRKSDHSPEKRRALKQVKSASGLLRPNLERISGSDTGSSESSAENLHLETSKQKLKRTFQSKSKEGGHSSGNSKKGSNKKETSKTENKSKSKVENLEIKSPSPPPSQVTKNLGLNSAS